MMNRRSLVATSALLVTLIVASTCLGQYVRPEGKTLRELAKARGNHFGANFGLLACGNHTDLRVIADSTED